MNSDVFVKIKEFDFAIESLPEISSDPFVDENWPLVYILSDRNKSIAYIGETANAKKRMETHLKDSKKGKLKTLQIITSNKFNKSATLDIESNLIKYIAGDGKYKLLNANLGLANHNYYQKKDVYWKVFKHVWEQLRIKGVTDHSLEQINNSDLFKYSPYKTLKNEQIDSIHKICKSLLDDDKSTILVEGGAGTGKTILATYLFKLLNTEISDLDFDEFETEGIEFLKTVSELKRKYPKPSMALVISMTSFRKTMQSVFRNVKGLASRMVIGPTQLVKRKYDIVIVDEAHRLKRRVNLIGYGAFDKANEKLGFDKYHGTELDWVLKQGQKSLLFYDSDQSIKPTDIEKEVFDELREKKTTEVTKLWSQFRVQGGTDYVNFIKRLLDCELEEAETFTSEKYEFQSFDNIYDLISIIKKKEKEDGLSRLVAGFAWKWISAKDNDLYDIEIEGKKLRWNTETKDWINSENSKNEVGCIHTIQGYDLNYVGVIFGNEICYDSSNEKIFIRGENYHDAKGKNTIDDPEILKEYIINIYRTIMLRGIRGTYVYACDPALREYLKRHIPNAYQDQGLQIYSIDDVEPYENAIPVYNIKVAAGGFSNNQVAEELGWAKLPEAYKPDEEYFICQVNGESMNRRIPNGAWCLFRKYSGGSREGKVVLVQHDDIHDTDFGAGFTVKKYTSIKSKYGSSWRHTSIVLKPESYSSEYEDIVLAEEESQQLKVIGLFVGLI
ncbi:MAG: DUF2075 domain-containing protein [bacterium]|nr:DUF2075 domain-containing protein [bacterium]